MVVCGTGLAQAPFTGAIEHLAEKYIRKKRNHSLVVALVTTEESHIRAFGTLGGERDIPADASTLFEIGGVTGVFTTTLMMIESQSGKFHIEDRVNDYLPADVKVPDYHPFVCHTEDEMPRVIDSDRDYARVICQPDPFASPVCITFCDLASHTSGLPSTLKGAPGKAALASATTRSTRYAHFDRQALYETLYRHTLSLPPGANYHYSDGGMALLGHLLADISQTSYDRLLADQVLRPLGLGHTGTVVQAKQAVKMAPGHDVRGRDVARTNYNGMSPALGLKSNAKDLTIFVQANLAPPIGPWENAFLQAQQSRVDVPHRKSKRRSMGGYGWLISHLSASSNLPVIWIKGTTDGHSTFLGFNKDTGRGIVLLSNSVSDLENIGFEMLEKFIGSKDKTIGS